MWVQKVLLVPHLKKRYEEGYDLEDPGYVAWLKINHPTEVCSITTKSSLEANVDSSDSGKSKPSSSDAVSEILVFSISHIRIQE